MSGRVNGSQQQGIEAGGLNARLDRLDILVSKLEPMTGKGALAILFEMDAIGAELEELRRSGASLKAEESQFETAGAGLKKQAGTFLRAVGGVNAFQEERSHRSPTRSEWWWYVDELFQQQRISSIKRIVTILVIAAVVVAALVVVYQKFLAPGPEVVARYDALQQSTNLAGQGKYAEALAAVQTGLAAVPDDPELLLMEGVLYDAQGNQEQASAIFTQARQKIGNGENFYLARCQDYLSLGKNEEALADAQTALAVNPDSAAGYFFLGSAQEALKQVAAALASYQKAAELADAQGLTSLMGEIKLRMGYLMQAAGAGLPVVTVTPTP